MVVQKSGGTCTSRDITSHALIFFTKNVWKSVVVQDGLRERSREAALKSKKKDTAESCDAISLDEEKRLIHYYALKLIELSKTIGSPDNVVCTACTYFLRFYVNGSCLEFDPQYIVLTCLYLASKIEDCYVSAEYIHRQGGMPEEIILKFEITVLQGLGFDLQVHPPHKALWGLIEALYSDADEAWKKNVLKKGKVFLENNILMSDALVLFTPGQLALKSLISAVTSSDSPTGGAEDADSADSIVQKAANFAEFGRVSDVKEENVQTEAILSNILDAIDRTVTGNPVMKEEDVKSVDRRLKLFLSSSKKSNK